MYRSKAKRDAAAKESIAKMQDMETRWIKMLKKLDEEICQNDIEWMNLAYVAQKINNKLPPQKVKPKTSWVNQPSTSFLTPQKQENPDESGPSFQKVKKEEDNVENELPPLYLNVEASTSGRHRSMLDTEEFDSDSD